MTNLPATRQSIQDAEDELFAKDADRDPGLIRLTATIRAIFDRDEPPHPIWEVLV